MTGSVADINVGACDAPFAATEQAYDFWSEVHCLAAEQLGFSIQSKISVTLLIGNAGAGKSIILRRVRDELSTNYLIGYLDDPSRLGVFPYNTVLTAFGAAPETQTKDTAVSVLRASFTSARKDHGLPTLLIDNVSAFKDDDLAGIFNAAGITGRMDDLLFKVVICGDVDLPERLQSRFSGLIGPSIRLENMSSDDTKDYILHRLACANYQSVMFSDEALDIIAKYSDGNPKLINIICQAALDAFQGSKDERIEAALVRKCFLAAGYALRREREVDQT